MRVGRRRRRPGTGPGARNQFRKVDPGMPNCSPTWLQARLTGIPGFSLIVSCTVRTARSRNSSLYFLGAGMTPLSCRGQDPPPNPGWFKERVIRRDDDDTGHLRGARAQLLALHDQRCGGGPGLARGAYRRDGFGAARGVAVDAGPAGAVTSTQVQATLDRSGFELTRRRRRPRPSRLRHALTTAPVDDGREILTEA